MRFYRGKIFSLGEKLWQIHL